MIEIRRCSEIEPYIKALVYGEPGAGKTTFACSSERHEALDPTLVVNVEGGMLSVSGTNAIATDQIKTIEEVDEIFWAIAHKAEGFDDIKTVVLDSGTALQTLLLGGISESKADSKRDLDTLYLEDYGKCTTRMKRIMRWYRDLPCNVIVTALVRESFPAPTKSQPQPDPIAAYPDFTKKLGNAIQGYFDHVWYMWRNVEAGTHHMLTQPAGIYKAKTRGHAFSKALGNKVDNPNLKEVYNLLLETEGNQS